jgi:hypothetical protein
LKNDNVEDMGSSIQLYICIVQYRPAIVYGCETWALNHNVSKADDVLAYIKTPYRSDLDRLCGLVARVLGYRSRGPGSIPGTTRKKVVGLEWCPLSLVSTTEELLDRKITAPV